MPRRQTGEIERVDAAARPRIVAAARRHFLTHGFRNVTMDDLAGELGMSKKTLYAHFSSKIALLEAVLLDKLNNLESDVAQIATQCRNFPQGLHGLLATVQRHTEEIQPPFLRDLQRESPELFGIVERRRRHVIQQHFGKLLAQGRRQGFIRKDIPVHLIIEILLGATQSIMNPLRLAELGLTPQSGFTAIITVILEGVVRSKGRLERWPASRRRVGAR